MSKPIVSVTISTYNRIDLLKISLKAILEQTYENLEIILIDDCSTDGTYEYLKSIKDKRINLIRNEENMVSKFGHTELSKKMVSLATGEYIMTMSDDDYWVNNDFIEECVNIMQKYNLSKVIGSQVNYHYDDNFERLTSDQIDNLIRDNNPLVYHHNNILPEGFITAEEYLNHFADKPAQVNISTSGTMFSKDKFLKSLTLQNKHQSKWQGGYELSIPGCFLGDVYYINKPCLMCGVKSTSLSFNFTQLEHLQDTLLSIDNGFENYESLVKNKSIFKKIYKKFVKNICETYLSNSIAIFTYGELSMCSLDNIKGYVKIKDVLKLYIKYGILRLNYKLFLRYLYCKYKLFPKYSKKFNN
jgi:glycosyltransferase involved in cell wall biosynthesis